MTILGRKRLALALIEATAFTLAGARALTVDEMQSIIQAFGQVTRRAIEVGLEDVELHSALSSVLIAKVVDSAGHQLVIKGSLTRANGRLLPAVLPEAHRY